MIPSSDRSLPDTPSSWISTTQAADFEAAGTNAYRLASGAAGWVERLGNDAMISHKTETALEEMTTGLEQWCAQSGWSPNRVFNRYLPFKNAERISPILKSGDTTLPAATVASEAGLQYEIDFSAGYSHGLFLDQRLNREKLSSLRPKRLLNTFAYTCSFSVVAALAGAETVSVDLSRKSLDRGRQNFVLNGIDPEAHRFIAGDVLELLPRLEGRGERFDAIILDPPTFSLSRNGRRWQVENHLEDLLNAALEVAMPKCAILLSINCAKINPTALDRRARACVKGKRLTADYQMARAPADFPPGHGATALWVMLR